MLFSSLNITIHKLWCKVFLSFLQTKPCLRNSQTLQLHNACGLADGKICNQADPNILLIKTAKFQTPKTKLPVYPVCSSHFLKTMWNAHYFNIVSSFCFADESEFSSQATPKTQKSILKTSYLFQHVWKFHLGHTFDRNGTVQPAEQTKSSHQPCRWLELWSSEAWSCSTVTFETWVTEHASSFDTLLRQQVNDCHV